MAPTRGMRIDDLFGLRAVGALAISPDGRRVIFELKRFVLEDNKNYVQLMVADVETRVVRPLTAAGKFSDTLPRFSPSGDRLAFVSTRDKTAALWVLPMSGGEPKRITDLDGSVSDFDWSPDGRRIVYVYQSLNERERLERDEKNDDLKRRPAFQHITRLNHKLDGTGFWNGHYKHLWLIDADGQGRSRQLTRGAFDHAHPRFSPDGRRVAFVSNRDRDPDRNFDQSAIYTIGLAGGRALKRVSPLPGEVLSFAWSPDGGQFAYIGRPNRPRQWSRHDEHLWLVSAAGGRARQLSREIDNACINATLGDIAISAFEAHAPIWSADGRHIYFLVSETGAVHLYEHDLKRRISRRVIDGEINIYHLQRTARDGRIALAIGTATNPGDAHVCDPHADFALTQLSRVNADVLRKFALVRPEPFWLKGRGGRIHCWIMRPPGFNRARRYPAILQIHGGPQAQYGCAFFHEMQMLAARGYVVVFSNPCGGAGYGFEHRRSIIGRWGTLDWDDLVRVGDWIFTRPFIDPQRVGVTGGSYGGYMTNWIIGHETRYAAAVTQRSCTNFESMFGTSDCGHAFETELGPPPWQDRATLWKQSPLAYVRRVQTPLLIVHSNQDLRCPIAQADELFTALKFLGKTVEYVAFEGESHGLSRGGRPQNRAERLRRIAGWFDRHLKPRR